MNSPSPDMAKKTRDTVGVGRAYSNRSNRKNKYNGQDSSTRIGRKRNKEGPLCNIDRERNCYSCGGIGHLAQNCRRWGIVGQERRIEYKDNLNGKKNLIVLD